MNIIAILFGVSTTLIIVPFIIDFLVNRKNIRTKDIFPNRSDYWTSRIMQLRGEKANFSTFRKLSKASYLNEYKS